MIDVIVRNPFKYNAADREIACVKIVMPPDWHVTPPQATTILEADAETHLKFMLDTPADNPKHYPNNSVLRRARIAADVTIGDRHFGQHAECLITTVGQAEIESDNLCDDS